MEDTGKLTLLGWSAGARSKRAFHWARNITSKKTDAGALNKSASNLFALAWQRMRSVLPTAVLDDFKNFVDDNGLPRMDPDNPLATLPPLQKGTADNDHPTGHYMVEINGDEFEFFNVELAPPAGVAGKNYSRLVLLIFICALAADFSTTRATHREAHPHKYAASWTISRTEGYPDGCHFFLARYGVRIQQAANTLIVWIPDEAHGTSLPNAHPSDPNPSFVQRGLAFVTSVRIAGAWKEFQANQKTAEQAQEMAKVNDDDKYEKYK